MSPRARAVTAIATILFCFCGAALAEATSMPAATATIGKATDAPPTNIEQLIAAIRDAKDVATAASSYAKARTLDKNNLELYDTYMKKMLKLGHPKIALYPAAELTRLQAKNGTAWAVLGYNDAKRYRYFTAFTSTIRGLALLPNDPGIQHNAGILMAWHETRRVKPKLAPALKAILAEHSQQWLEKAKYAQAHRKCKSEFAARASRMEKLKAELRPAEKAAKEASRDSSEAASRYRRYSRELVSLDNELRALERSLQSAERNRFAAKEEDRRRYERYIDEMKRRIRSGESKFKSLKKNRDQYRKRAVEKNEVYTKAKKTLAKARAALKAEEKTMPSLSWLPPAVDGVITPEDPNPPKYTAHADPTPKPSAVSAAEKQLKMAKLMLTNDRKDKAMVILTAIVKKYPDTNAAKEAADLLKKLKAEEPEEL